MISTVVGNYPKISATAQAANLRTAISRFDAGRITQEELDGVVEEVTREAIQEQVEAGIDLVTDGQIRWDDGQTYVARGIKGFNLNGLTRYFDTNTYFRQPVPQDRLEWQGPITVADFKFAMAASPKPVKPVLVGPFTLGHLSQLGRYSDRASLVLDLANILNQEALALQDAGATIVQLDEPALLKHKDEFTLFQEASAAVTSGLRIKAEVCTYFGDVSGIHSEFFQLPFQVFGLDFVMGKANFELIRDLPSDRELAAGIVDARNTKMETVEELVAAISRISGHVPLARLQISPSAGLEFLPRPTARAKLLRLVEGTNRAQEVLN